ncbi:MAG TPA: hypothetical protein VMU93_04175 [Caulobacteraceae bacterium]|nr:hypothetical protein [Caulobacteraceae bacterium]
MMDKNTTVPKIRSGARAGRLDGEDVLRLNEAGLVFLARIGSAQRAEVADKDVRIMGCRHAPPCPRPKVGNSRRECYW